ncbi:MAG: twin-arginine translocase subunit TatC [Bacteroidia bacterium]|nr:twin-arginine translocase subunit TatC [Bacteroidia bacterium]
MFFNLFRKNPVAASDDMTFLQHLEALRWHLMRASIVVILISIAAFFQKEWLFDTVLFGPKKADFPTYKFMCWLAEKLSIDDLCISEISFKLQSTEMSQQFTLHMWVAFYAGLVMSFPYVLWELWRFIKPALSVKEKQYTTGVVFVSSLLFFLGVLFGYYVIAPLSINFLGSYSVSTEVQNIFTIDSFISIITMLTLATGVVFQLPILVFFLAKIGLLTPGFMRAYRKHALVVILIIAAVITPSPDVTSQILVALPLYALYEISIGIAALVVSRSNAKK